MSLIAALKMRDPDFIRQLAMFFPPKPVPLPGEPPDATAAPPDGPAPLGVGEEPRPSMVERFKQQHEQPQTQEAGPEQGATQLGKWDQFVNALDSTRQWGEGTARNLGKDLAEQPLSFWATHGLAALGGATFSALATKALLRRRQGQAPQGDNPFDIHLPDPTEAHGPLDDTSLFGPTEDLHSIQGQGAPLREMRQTTDGERKSLMDLFGPKTKAEPQSLAAPGTTEPSDFDLQRSAWENQAEMVRRKIMDDHIRRIAGEQLAQQQPSITQIFKNYRPKPQSSNPLPTPDMVPENDWLPDLIAKPPKTKWQGGSFNVPETKVAASPDQVLDAKNWMEKGVTPTEARSLLKITSGEATADDLAVLDKLKGSEAAPPPLPARGMTRSNSSLVDRYKDWRSKLPPSQPLPDVEPGKQRKPDWTFRLARELTKLRQSLLGTGVFSSFAAAHTSAT